MSVTARLLGLREDVGYTIVREELSRRLNTPMSSRTARESQILGSLNFKFVQLTIYRQLVIDTVEQLARQDSVQTRQQINQAVLDNSIKEELISVINRVSRSTSGVDR